jgi:hypothetical protein
MNFIAGQVCIAPHFFSVFLLDVRFCPFFIGAAASVGAAGHGTEPCPYEARALGAHHDGGWDDADAGGDTHRRGADAAAYAWQQAQGLDLERRAAQHWPHGGWAARVRAASSAAVSAPRAGAL